MTNKLQCFAYNDKVVRTVEKDGEPWWVLRDICAALEIDNCGNIATRLDDDEKGYEQIYTTGVLQKMTIVSKSGLYNAIYRSDKPEAKRFRQWFTHDIFPELNKKRTDAVELNLLKETEKRFDQMICVVEKIIETVNFLADEQMKIGKAMRDAAEKVKNKNRHIGWQKLKMKITSLFRHQQTD